MTEDIVDRLRASAWMRWRKLAGADGRRADKVDATADRQDEAADEIERLRRVIALLRREQIMLAKLAADEPAFHSPGYAAAAIQIRDQVLREERS